MALARHMAIERRLLELAQDNEDLDADITKLEDTFKQHNTLTSDKDNPLTPLRKEIGGSVWKQGLQGKLKVYRSSQDVQDNPRPLKTMIPVSILRNPLTSGQRSRYGLTSKEKPVESMKFAANGSTPSEERDQGSKKQPLKGNTQAEGNRDVSREKSIKTKPTDSKERQDDEGEVSVEKRMHASRTTSRNPRIHQRSQSLNRQRSKSLTDPEKTKVADDCGITEQKQLSSNSLRKGRSFTGLALGTSSVSDSEDDHLFDPNFEKKSYEERVTAMKEKVLKKMLHKTDLQNKLKDFKKHPKVKKEKVDVTSETPLQTNSSNGRRRTEARHASLNNKSNDQIESVKSDKLSTPEGKESSPEQSEDLEGLQIQEWLRGLELKEASRYTEILRTHGVTMDGVRKLKEKDLQAMGIHSYLVLNRLLGGIKDLRIAQGLRRESKSDTNSYSSGTKDTLSLHFTESSVSNSERECSPLDNKSRKSETPGEEDSQGKRTFSKINSPKKPPWGSGIGSRSNTKIKPTSKPSSETRPRTCPGSMSNETTQKHPQAAWGRTTQSEPQSSESSEETLEDEERTEVKVLTIKSRPQPPSQETKSISSQRSPRTRLYRRPAPVRKSLALPVASFDVRDDTTSLLGGAEGNKLKVPDQDKDKSLQGSPQQDVSPRTTTAQTAFQAMESQIHILQEQVAVTGDQATTDMICQLQQQLGQLQNAVIQDHTTTGTTRSTTPGIIKTTQGNKQTGPGNLITAALQGNLRPVSSRVAPPPQPPSPPPVPPPPIPQDPLQDQDHHQTFPDEDWSDHEGNVVSPTKPTTRPTSGSTVSGGQRRSQGSTPSKVKGSILSLSMSKQQILKEVRKQTEEHRRTVRHLESELSRLKHKDPLKACEIPAEEVIFDEEDLIGEGAFSKVFHGVFQGSEVAIKRLNVPLNSQDKNYFTAEVNLLRELRHPRVVLLMGVCTTSQRPLMVLEYMNAGSLYGYLHDKNKPSLDHAAYYLVARDIALGMNYLHRHRPTVLHLDLKSMNVLLTNHLHAKIADFGFSKLRHDAEVVMSERGGLKGTPSWMAPELLDTGDITPKADVYSYSIILWEMVTRSHPYPGCSMFQVLERVRTRKRPTIPTDCPDGLVALIIQCWDHLPTKRPTFEIILNKLEELQFPREWKSLFAAAGIPQDALDDLEATRTLINIVTETVSGDILDTNGSVANHCQSDTDPRSKERTKASRSRVSSDPRSNAPYQDSASIRRGKGKRTSVKSSAGDKNSSAARLPPPAPPPPMAPPPPPPPLPPQQVLPSNTQPPATTDFLLALKAGIQDVRLKRTERDPDKTNPVSQPSTGFLIAASELQQRKNELKPVQHPHPSCLQDLNGVSKGTISGLTDVLRRAVNERRVALNEYSSIDQSCTDSVWSVGDW